MTVNLSSLAGAGAQFFDNNGVILSGGKLYSYAAGTTTPQTTYTSASGSTAHTNPIILNSAGRIATGEIWLTAGIDYKFVLSTSTDVILVTWDNIDGINDINASDITVDYRGDDIGIQQAFDDVSDEIDALQNEIDSANKVNYNWMGFFETWQNGHAFKVRTGAREIGCSGATFARIGFADDNVTMLHVKGIYQPSGIRIQRSNLNVNTASATMVMNLTQTETKPLLGQNICLQLHALKAAGFTGSTINVRLQYSKEPQQPIVLADGTYTSGHVVLVDDDFTLTTSMTAKDSPYVITGLLPSDAIQVAMVVTVPWTGAAGVEDFVDVEGCFLTVGTVQSGVINQTFNDLIVKAKTRYQTTYPYTAPRGATTKAVSMRVTAINTDPINAVISSVRFDPPMAIIPQVLMQSPLSGTENRWENETTGVFVNGLPYNLSDQGITLQNNGAVTAGDVLLCHWTARCVF
jgi:hypothetical protein